MPVFTLCSCQTQKQQRKRAALTVNRGPANLLKAQATIEAQCLRILLVYRDAPNAKFSDDPFDQLPANPGASGCT